MDPEEAIVYLIQLLLPAIVAQPDDSPRPVARTRREQVEAFGGLTRRCGRPPRASETSAEGGRERDEVVTAEVAAEPSERGGWREDSDRLAPRFAQDAIHVRALQVDLSTRNRPICQPRAAPATVGEDSFDVAAGPSTAQPRHSRPVLDVVDHPVPPAAASKRCSCRHQ